jgi:hypothetical protein
MRHELMNNIIGEYQRWKQQGKDLRTQAKTAMENRYRELLLEAIQIAEEYRSDFGATLKPPPAVTAFRYKATARTKPHGPAKNSPSPKTPAKTAVPAKAAVPPKPEPVPAKPDPKVAGLQKKLDNARKKLDAAKAAGSPTKNLEDRVYEIEDDLRLAQQSS